MADRGLTDTLRYLQYPHPLSADSFETPNFELVAGILYWLVQRLDPTISIYEKIVTEDDKVTLLNGISAEIAAKFNLNVDTTDLYAADYRAVKELLKVANILREAFTLADESSSDEEIQPDAIQRISTCAKKAQSLVSDITEISASLNNLLENEREDSQEREQVLQFLNSSASMPGRDGSKEDYIASCVASVLESTGAAADVLNRQCKMLISSQRGVEEKIRKKTIDVERSSKRLESLQHTRPSYMDEYEQLEEELKVEYEGYVVRLRNVDYFQEELSSFKRAAMERQERAERFARRLQNKFREEELRILDRGRDLEGEESPVHPRRHGAHKEATQTGDVSCRSTREEQNDSFSSSSSNGSSAPSSEGGISLEGSEITGSLESGGESDYDF